MIRIYKEHPEFNEYTKYDTLTGLLEPISLDQFKGYKSSTKSNVEVFDWTPSETHTRFPRRVYFQITRSCNLLCDYCFIKASSQYMHLEKDVICKVAELFGKKGLMEIRLTGGEPTTHPSFIEIFNEFQKHNIYVSVATNGCWSKEIKDFFSSVRNLWLIVSIDGGREVHNKLRNNTYDIIVDNIKEIQSLNQNIRLRLNTVLTKHNKYELENLAMLTKELNAENITIIPLRPQVRNLEALKAMPTAAEFKQAIIDMVACKEKYGINFTTTLETEYKDKIQKDKIFNKKSSCAAGREGTNLDFDFERKKLFVYACSYCPATDLDELNKIREPFVAGEFGYNDIEKFFDIWETDSNWSLFRRLDIKHYKCKTCSEWRVRCSGSCPIQNIDYDTIDLASDVKNQLIEQNKKNTEWYCYKNIFSD